MRINNQGLFNTNGLFKLKNHDWLEKQRIAGKVAAEALNALEKLVKTGTTKSLLELDKFAYEYISDNKCTATFLGYHNFPNSVCISVNRQLVHGIPSNYQLQSGDIVSFDLGATYQGAIADTAITCIFGEPKSEQHVKLLKATEDALMKGIEAVKVGNRLGCIGHAIYHSAKKNGFSVVTKYGGHGISWDTPHDTPFVSNRDILDNGIRIQPGLSIAIEPMLVIGSPNTRTLHDGWTVVTNDIGSHQEHSIFVHPDHVEIITDRNL